MKVEMEGYLVKPEEHQILFPWTELQVVWSISRAAAFYASWEYDPEPISQKYSHFFQ